MPEHRHGPEVVASGVIFRLWSPDAHIVELEIRDRAPIVMQDRGNGWKEAFAVCGPGARYRFRVGGVAVPDPASRLQAGGVHGWSVICAPTGPPNAESWHGRPWIESIIYEVHPGIAGGFVGLAAMLPTLREIGFAAIELMPIAAFPGQRNWGYDGVLPFAPSEAYGGPEELRALIGKAHALGLMVYLDVVYNHFGPDGNYLPLYAKSFFRADIATPWGAAINFQREPVRGFFAQNARYWIEEFGFDGLRFDAIHAMHAKDFLADLAHEIRSSVVRGRHVHLMLENEDNTATLLEQGYDAQWNDDIHHALHALLTGEHDGYYGDFANAPAESLARALAEGFIYQGEFSPDRDTARGKPSGSLPLTAFIAFLQNHDQIGNRAQGERLTALADTRALKAAITLLLLSPQIPMVFMGEEIGSHAPFLYFTDHNEDLAGAVRKARQREFAAFHQNDSDALPDPNAPETFARSHPSRDATRRREWQRLYRDLIELRTKKIIPHLEGARALSAEAVSAKAVCARWRLSNGATLTIASNFDRKKGPCGFAG